MTRVEQWPPPDWTEVRVSWQLMLDSDNHNPRTILDWIDRQPGGRYHLHGWEAWDQVESHGIPPRGIDGFAFRFEDPADAVIFQLTWGV
jgi:hypothetical protein